MFNCRITAFKERSNDINNHKLGHDGRPLAPPEPGVEIESFVLTSVQSSSLEHTGLRDLRRADVTLSGLSSGSRYRLQVTAFNSLSEAEARERLTSNEPQMFEIAVTTLNEPDPIILRENVEENANDIPPIADDDISNGVSSDTNRRPWSAEDHSLPPDEVMVVEVEASSMPSKIMKPPPPSRGPRLHEKSDQPLLIPINDPIRLLPIIGEYPLSPFPDRQLNWEWAAELGGRFNRVIFVVSPTLHSPMKKSNALSLDQACFFALQFCPLSNLRKFLVA